MKGNPRLESAERQKGYSLHSGLRGVTAGWHVNGSLWKTKSETTRVDMHALGAGMHLFGLLLYGERNWRTLSQADNTAEPVAPEVIPRVHPSSTISEYTAALTFIRGVIAGGVLEDMLTEGRHCKRRSGFIDLHPIPFVQLEVWRRFEYGEQERTDTLMLAHLYADF